MNPWAYLLPAALITFLAVFIKLSRGTTRKSVPAILGLVAFATCLTMNTPALYPVVDASLGGTNVAYLAVQLTYVIAMFFMGAAILPHTDQEGNQHLFRRSDIFLLFAVVGLIFFLFCLTPMNVSAYRVEPYRAEWTVVGFTQLVNLYSLYIAIPIVTESVYRARIHSQRPAVRIGHALLAAGFSIGILTAIKRIVLQLLYIAAPETQQWQLQLDGYFVALSMIAIAAGWAVVLFSVRRPSAHHVTKEKLTVP